MGSPLTAPGTLPGLLRKCLPAIDPDWADCSDRRRGVVTAAHEGEHGVYQIDVAWEWDGPGDGDHEEARPQDVLLDLSDPTGQQHLANWVARQVDPEARRATWRAGTFNSGHVFVELLWFRADKSQGAQMWTEDDIPALARHRTEIEAGNDVGALLAVALHVALETYPENPSAAEWRAMLEAM